MSVCRGVGAERCDEMDSNFMMICGNAIGLLQHYLHRKYLKGKIMVTHHERDENLRQPLLQSGEAPVADEGEYVVVVTFNFPLFSSTCNLLHHVLFGGKSEEIGGNIVFAGLIIIYTQAREFACK